MSSTFRSGRKKSPVVTDYERTQLMSAPFVWYDLTASPADADRAREFYAKLFGWQIAPDTSPGPYNGLMMDGQQPSAAVVEATEASAGHWVPYVKVDDLEQATAAATSLGGTVVVEATDGPAGTAVLVADPAGALVALWVPFPNAE